MIFGELDDNKYKRWDKQRQTNEKGFWIFAIVPHRLRDGRYAWFQRLYTKYEPKVWHFMKTYDDSYLTGGYWEFDLCEF